MRDKIIIIIIKKVRTDFPNRRERNVVPAGPNREMFTNHDPEELVRSGLFPGRDA